MDVFATPTCFFSLILTLNLNTSMLYAYHNLKL